MAAHIASRHMSGKEPVHEVMRTDSLPNSSPHSPLQASYGLSRIQILASIGHIPESTYAVGGALPSITQRSLPMPIDKPHYAPLFVHQVVRFVALNIGTFRGTQGYKFFGLQFNLPASPSMSANLPPDHVEHGYCSGCRSARKLSTITSKSSISSAVTSRLSTK